MRDLAAPLITAVRISVVSSPALATKATAITSLLLIPLSETVLLVAVAAAFGVEDLARAAYAAALLALGLSVLGGTVAHVARDKQTGVLLELLTRNFFHPPYWISKVVVPSAVGTAVATVTGLGVLLLDGGASATQFGVMMASLPVVVVSASLAGISVATLGLLWRDPFLLGNIVTAVLPITAGVVVPITEYPDLLASLTHFFPLTSVVSGLSDTSALFPAGLAALAGREFLVSAVWLMVALALSRRVLRKMRNGRVREDLL